MKNIKKKPKINYKMKFIILSTLLVFLLGATILINIYFYLTGPILSKEIEVDFQVTDYYGLNVGPDLNFGSLPRGAAASKKITLRNEYTFPVKISVLTSSSLQGYIFGGREIYIEPGNVYYYSVSLKIPKDAEFGNYSGTILLETYPAE